MALSLKTLFYLSQAYRHSVKWRVLPTLSYKNVKGLHNGGCALASVTRLVGHCPMHCKVASLILGQDTCPGYGLDPW